MLRRRRAVDDKENDFKFINKKNNMLCSLNYKSETNPIKQQTLKNDILSFNHSPAIKSTLPMQLGTLSSFNRQLTNTQLYYRQYMSQLHQSTRDNPKPVEFLKKHKITAALRARMIDWMVEVIQSYKFQPKTFFIAVKIMDLYFQREQQTLGVQKLHITGVIAMLIASKMEEVFPFRMKTIFEKIVHKKISISDLIQMQAKIFEVIGYNGVTNTLYDKFTIQLHRLINENSSTNKIKQDLEKIGCLLGRLLVYNYDIQSKFNSQVEAATVLNLAKEILNVKEIVYVKTDVEDCKCLLKSTIKDFKKQFKGLNNIFKFSEPSALKYLEQYFNI